MSQWYGPLFVAKSAVLSAAFAYFSCQFVMGIGCTPRYPDPTQACAAACDRLAELECEAAQPTPEGATCLMICLDTEGTHWTTMHPACVAVAESCEEASRVSADGCAP
jgi:hypothetical protein